MVFMLGKIQFIEFILSTLFVNNSLMSKERWLILHLSCITFVPQIFWVVLIGY